MTCLIFKSSKAFTLAEVLITLLIIGVVAGLVVPALIADTQEQELHTAWRKVFSDFIQAATYIRQDNGGTLSNVFTDVFQLKNTFLQKLPYTKDCNNTTGCWHLHNTMKYLNGTPYPAMPSSSAILNNGVLVGFAYASSVCSPYCADLFVDVNGFRGPNTLGKDVFYIQVYTTSVKAGGFGYTMSQLTSGTEGCHSGGKGWYCSALYLMQ